METKTLPHQWVTLKQAMEITGFSKSYLMTAMHNTIDPDFHLPYHQYQPGSPYRIKRQDLVDWMNRYTS